MQSPGGVLCKKGVHKKVCSVSRKALVLEFLFFNKAADWRPAALSKKKRFQHRCFSASSAKSPRTNILKNTYEHLLLLLKLTFLDNSD